jgi:putative Ca2+/H+ antiporter (TMEM165/GDT1 family)
VDWKVLITVFSAVFIAELGGKTQLATMLSSHISEKHLHYIAGAGFIAIGVWTLLRA